MGQFPCAGVNAAPLISAVLPKSPPHTIIWWPVHTDMGFSRPCSGDGGIRIQVLVAGLKASPCGGSSVPVRPVTPPHTGTCRPVHTAVNASRHRLRVPRLRSTGGNFKLLPGRPPPPPLG